MCVYARAHVCVDVSVCLCVCRCVHLHVYVQYIHEYVCVCMHVCMCVQPQLFTTYFIHLSIKSTYVRASTYVRICVWHAGIFSVFKSLSLCSGSLLRMPHWTTL